LSETKHFAHSAEGLDKSKWQPLAKHLQAVSRLTAARAAKLGAANLGEIIGLLHDLGKYSAEYQAYIAGQGPSPDHATAGAVVIQKLVNQANIPERWAAMLAAYCIAGHHSGLANWIGDRPLSQRLRKELPVLDPVWQAELVLAASDLFPAGIKSKLEKSRAGFQLSVLGRMLYSCLLDADFLDTEAFYLAIKGESVDREWPALPLIIDTLIARFGRHMAGMPSRRLSVLRADILAHARSKAGLPRGVFTLNVPTGGGKTLTSLGFALDHAKAHGLERIVYGIPYTSIIDQTADVFRAVIGDGVILEHHSGFDPLRDLEAERDVRDKMRLAMQDWAAPVIVTTNVQLFESLFANRSSRCRKLHNLVNSVIILDESQTIPLPLLRPCVAALDELMRNYGCSVVLCTATQPALAAPHFEGGFSWSPERELAPDPGRLARTLRRVTFDIRQPKLSDADLVREIGVVEQALVIVNTRSHALDLYNTAKAARLSGLVHLTTRQTASDRRQILVRIREDLRKARACRVIATSLVEAGVDLDFPRVWRARRGSIRSPRPLGAAIVRVCGRSPTASSRCLLRPTQNRCGRRCRWSLRPSV
jgi:CRISPR-associated endonuclease/helicase Cas3